MDSRLLRTAQYLLTVVFSQVLSFLLLPIATRYLAPSEYGAYALALAVSAFIGMVSSSWIRNVGLRLYYDASGRGVTRGFYIGTAAVQAATVMVTYSIVILVMLVFGVLPTSISVLLFAGAALLIGDQYSYAITLLRAEERGAAFTIAEIGSGALRFGVTVIGLQIGFARAETLFVGMGIAYLLASMFAIPALWRRLTGPAKLDRYGLLELFRLGPAAIPGSFSAWLDNLANRLVLQTNSGAAAVGVFTVGFSIGERLVGSLSQAVFMMAWPNLLSEWRTGGTIAARKALMSAQSMYAFLTVGPVVFLMAFPLEVTRLLTAPSYYDASSIVPLVALSMWFYGFATYLNRHLELNKRFGRLSLIALSGSIVNVVLSVALVSSFGMVGIATAGVISSSLTCAFYFLTRDTSLTQVNYRAFLSAGALSGVAYAISVLAPNVAGSAGQLQDYIQPLTFIATYVAGFALILFGWLPRSPERPGRGQR